jgi:hypothetical protein
LKSCSDDNVKRLLMLFFGSPTHDPMAMSSAPHVLVVFSFAVLRALD